MHLVVFLICLFFSVILIIVAEALSTTVKSFCLCRLALACALLKHIASSPKGKTVQEVSHEEADLIHLSW